MSHQITQKTKTFFAVLCVLVTVVLGPKDSFADAHSRTDKVREPDMFKRSWNFKVTPNLAVLPVVGASAVYFVDSENHLLAVDSVNASRLWSTDVGGEVASNLLLSDSSIVLATNSQAAPGGPVAKTLLRSISRETGITEWRVEIGSASIIWIGAYPNAIVAVGESGSVAALSPADGKVFWERQVGSTITASPVFAAAGISLGTVQKEIVDILAADGGSRIVWKSEYMPTALVTEGSGRLVVGDERGSVTSIGANGDRSWMFRNGARISSVLLSDDEYLASSHDNFIYRLTRGGNVRWKRRLPGRLSQAPLILDDVAVMSVSGGGGVFVLDLNKGKILDRIEIAEDNSFAIGGSTANTKNFVVAGPSGVSYFSREKRP